MGSIKQNKSFDLKATPMKSKIMGKKNSLPEIKP